MRLDPRAWLLWWTAASIPALIGRNPFMLLTVLTAILVVRSTMQPANPIVSAGVMRLFVLFVGISVLFNALTVHAGDRELVSLPDWVPVAGGSLTLNAVFYGLLSALALLSLVLAGLTVAENIDWATALRLIPDAFLSVGAASSIAFAFFPQMLASFRELREARLLRGAPVTSPRDYASLIAPVLSTGLDRAITLSELLEVRSFGASSRSRAQNHAKPLIIPGSIVLLVIAVYLFSTGELRYALLTGMCAVVLLCVLVAGKKTHRQVRTRYRDVVWSHSDTIVAVGAALALFSVVLTMLFEPDGVRYEPYPEVDWPSAQIPLLLGLSALICPALLALRMEHAHD